MSTALLLSGGMDSIALAFWLRPEIAITIDYGQKAALGEIRSASSVAMELDIEHHVLTADLRGVGSGDMAGTPALTIAPVSEWWPFRNQLLITIAAMKAVSMGLDHLLIGAVASDGCHADGRPAFIEAMAGVLKQQEGSLSLEAPAITLTTSQLVTKSGVTLDLLAWAHSCHVSDYACGQCRGCQKHYNTYEELGAVPF